MAVPIRIQNVHTRGTSKLNSRILPSTYFHMCAQTQMCKGIRWQHHCGEKKNKKKPEATKMDIKGKMPK